MAAYKKTQIRSLPKIGQKVTADTTYWRKLNFPVTVKEFGPIDYIDVMPLEPHFFAVSCASRVQIYNPITHQVQKHFTRFKDAAFGGSFRSDGKLLIAGTDEGHVKLFDVGSKSLLRVFKGHKSATHRCKFTMDDVHIVSFSDDKSVALWDIPSETQVVKFSEHSDYVRAGSVSAVSPDLFLSGSFDHTVKLYDARTPSGSTVTVDHGSPVESVLIYPGNSIFVSVGGTELRVWDMLTGGRLLARVSQHHKTITCLHLASNGKRLVTGGLDRHAKIYDIQSYQVVHTLDFPSPVLSLGITPDDFTVVAGMANGLISIQHRQTNAEARALNSQSRKEKQREKQLDETAYRYRAAADHRPTFNSSTDVTVASESRTKVPRHDALLRKFQYSKALDSVVGLHYRKKPWVVVGVIQELIRRAGLETAIAGRDERGLVPILTFLTRYVNDPGYSEILMRVTNVVLDVYENSHLTAQTEKLLLKLMESVVRESEYEKHIMQIEGMLHILLASGATRNQSASSAAQSSQKTMAPSAAAAAGANVVYNVC